MLPRRGAEIREPFFENKNMALLCVSRSDVGRSALAIPKRSCHAGPPGHNGVQSKLLALFARDVLGDTGFG